MLTASRHVEVRLCILEYEVANVVDPNLTVVAKMRKSLLAGFTRPPR